MTQLLARMLRVAVLCIAALASTLASAIGTGEPSPGFALLNAAGELVALDHLQGRVVYVDFWASWCGPCRRSFPWMNELRQRYRDTDLVIIGINVDKRRSDADRFLLQTPAAFTVLFDAAGVTPSAWGVRAMPSSYLIDRQGKVVAVETGFDDDRKSVVEERIRKLLEAH